MALRGYSWNGRKWVCEEASCENEATENQKAIENQAPPREVIVTAGPIAQSYEVVGPVHVSTVGTIVINVGSFLTDSLFRSPLERAAQGSTPKASYAQMNENLKARAIELYGRRVDAVINVTYQTRPDGDVFADGLAVHFTQVQQLTPVQQPPPQAAPAKRSTQERLDELKSLLDHGSINREEYKRKREEILKEL